MCTDKTLMLIRELATDADLAASHPQYRQAALEILEEHKRIEDSKALDETLKIIRDIP